MKQVSIHCLLLFSYARACICLHVHRACACESKKDGDCSHAVNQYGARGFESESEKKTDFACFV